MNITEKAAYLKGLVEGSDLKLGDKETKVFNALLDLVQEMADVLSECDQDLTDLYEDVAALEEETDEINDVIDVMLEEDYYDDDDDCCCCDDCDDDYDDYEEYDDEDCLYDVTCPACEKEFSCDEDTIMEGSVTCPFCGENIEFDLSDCCDDDCCDCGCGCHCHDEE